MLATPAVLKHLDRAQASLGNLLFGTGERRAGFLLGTTRCNLTFKPFGRKIRESAVLSITVDGLGFEVIVPGVFFMENLPGFPGDEALADLPPELGNALVEVALEEILDAFDAWADTRSSVTGYGLDPSGPDERADRVRLNLDLAREGGDRIFPVCLIFVVIDLVISNILLAMGMMMVSPMTISLPFKLLLFVLIEGWARLIHGLVLTYR